MIYDTLSSFYDALVKDDEATREWVSLIQQWISKGSLLELACGSGEITIALAEQGYTMTASDISQAMLREAQKKPGSEKVTWKTMDMRDIRVEDVYDGILCLCDSFNYLLEEEDVITMFSQVKQHLKPNGIFLMDMHSMDRLKEFQEEYNEAGRIDHHEYQWTIQTMEDRIYQNFAFYDETGRAVLEQHVQRVYEPNWVKKELEAIGFEVTIITDFNQKGIQEGEKLFYICRRVCE